MQHVVWCRQRMVEVSAKKCSQDGKYIKKCFVFSNSLKHKYNLKTKFYG